MQNIVFQLSPDCPESVSGEFLRSAESAGIGILRRASDDRLPYPADCLVITDLPYVIRRCLSSDLPVIGFEHSERLPGPEIISSLTGITLEYCIDRYDAMRGFRVIYRDGDISFTELRENDFITAYNAYRREPFFLTPEEASYGDEDVRRLYLRRSVSMLSFDTTGSFSVAFRGEPVGYAGVTASDSEPLIAAVDYYVFPSLRGRGYGRLIAAALVSYIRSLQPHFSKITATVVSKNVASAALLTSLGFRCDAPQETPSLSCTPTPEPKRRSRECPSLRRSVYSLPLRS